MALSDEEIDCKYADELLRFAATLVGPYGRRRVGHGGAERSLVTGVAVGPVSPGGWLTAQFLQSDGDSLPTTGSVVISIAYGAVDRAPSTGGSGQSDVCPLPGLIPSAGRCDQQGSQGTSGRRDC